MTHMTLPNTDPRNEFSWPRAALESIITFLSQTSQAMDCARDAERLLRLSDVELYRLGVKRDEVIQHAFRGFLGH